MHTSTIAPRSTIFLPPFLRCCLLTVSLPFISLSTYCYRFIAHFISKSYLRAASINSRKQKTEKKPTSEQVESLFLFVAAKKMIVNNGVKLVSALENEWRKSERERWWRNNWNKLSMAPTQDNHIKIAASKNSTKKRDAKRHDTKQRRWRSSNDRWITFNIYFGGNGRSGPLRLREWCNRYLFRVSMMLN